jgi:hypothetical protein
MKCKTSCHLSDLFTDGLLSQLWGYVKNFSVTIRVDWSHSSMKKIQTPSTYKYPHGGFAWI